MNRHMKVLLGAVLAVCAMPGVALAGNTKPVDQTTQKELVAKITAAGYTDVKNIVMDGELYVANAKKTANKFT